MLEIEKSTKITVLNGKDNTPIALKITPDKEQGKIALLASRVNDPEAPPVFDALLDSAAALAISGELALAANTLGPDAQGSGENFGKAENSAKEA